MEVSEWGRDMGAKIIWGGPGPSILPELMLRDGPVDVLVLGEGEETMADLVDALNKGQIPRRGRRDSVPQGWRVHQNAPETEDEESGRPPPSTMEGPANFYRYHIPLHGRTAVPLITSRGCPGNCTFCYTKGHVGLQMGAALPRNDASRRLQLVRSIDPDNSERSFSTTTCSPWIPKG